MLISLTNVIAGYDGRIQLRCPKFTVSDGEFVGISGPNGGGKTTLVRVVLGLLKPMSGDIEYGHSSDETAGHVAPPRIGYLPQSAAIDRQFPISVADTVLTALATCAPTLRHSAAARQLAHDAMVTTDVLHLADSPISRLSGGQLQRVLLARAIAPKPQMLVFDEPDTYVDAAFRQQMHDLLQRLQSQCAIVVVSHDHDYLAHAATRRYHVNETVEEITSNH